MQEKINSGEMWVSLHNFCMLVVLHLKARRGCVLRPPPVSV